MSFTIEVLNRKRHNRQAFDCGLAEVNTFLQQQARQQMDRRINRTWVICDAHTEVPSPIAGYFTLTQATVVREELPEQASPNQFPNYQLPVLKLAWLGVCRRYQASGHRIGETLLVEAIDHAQAIVDHNGFGFALVVDPLTDASYRFFTKYGFIETEHAFGERRTLFLPLGY